MHRLPENWTRKTLNEYIGDIRSGTSVNCQDRAKVDKELGVLKTSAISDGRFYPNENKAVLASELDRVSVNPIQDSIVICRSNTPELVGLSAHISENYPDLFLPDTLWLLTKANHSFSMRWLNYYLNSEFMQNEIRKIASGTSSNMKKISMRNFLRLPIIAPPLPVQSNIAQILSTWDEAIAMMEKIIAVLKERKQEIMQRLLTGRVRFSECSSDWHEIKLGDVFIERTETGFEQLPLVSITMENGIIWRDELDRKDTSSVDKSNYLRICPGDIGYNTMRMWQGVSGVSNIEGIVSPAYTICTPSEDVDADFMGYLFQLPEMIHKFWRYSQGLVKDTLTLRFSNFADIKTNIPSSKLEQSKIAEVLRTLDENINQLEAYKSKLRAEKRSNAAVVNECGSGKYDNAFRISKKRSQ